MTRSHIIRQTWLSVQLFFQSNNFFYWFWQCREASQSKACQELSILCRCQHASWSRMRRLMTMDLTVFLRRNVQLWDPKKALSFSSALISKGGRGGWNSSMHTCAMHHAALFTGSLQSQYTVFYARIMIINMKASVCIELCANSTKKMVKGLRASNKLKWISCLESYRLQ